MTFPPFFRYKGEVYPAGSRFVRKGDEPFALRPVLPTWGEVIWFGPDGWSVDIDDLKPSDAMPFDEWIVAAHEYQNRFPSGSVPRELPAQASDLPLGTVFVIHLDQAFAITPPADLPTYEIFSHAFGPNMGRFVANPDLSGAVDVPINEWFALAEEGDRRAFAGEYDSQIVSELSLRQSDFPPGTIFVVKEDSPFAVFPGSSPLGERVFSYWGGNKARFPSSTNLAGSNWPVSTSFARWMETVEESVRDKEASRASRDKAAEDDSTPSNPV